MSSQDHKLTATAWQCVAVSIAACAHERGASATGWQNHCLPTTTAFVVELPRGALSHTRLERAAAAIHTLAR